MRRALEFPTAPFDFDYKRSFQITARLRVTLHGPAKYVDAHSVRFARHTRLAFNGLGAANVAADRPERRVWSCAPATA